MRVLILGVTGMLGSAVWQFFMAKNQHEVWGSIRSDSSRRHFAKANQSRLISGIDVLDPDMLMSLLKDIKPDVVINCIGLIKQLGNANNPLAVLPVNAMLPHRLSNMCALAGARLLHISTDCVFSGHKGNYVESDFSDAEDLYGKSKYIGELHEERHAITLRTSIIGHELDSKNALVDWFLSQSDVVKGYTKAIFSGLSTFELARVMHDYVLPNADLYGLYHVSAEPISKFELLQLIASQYKKDIQIIPDGQLVIDRSLNSMHFQKTTGYTAPDWPALIACMHQQRLSWKNV